MANLVLGFWLETDLGLEVTELGDRGVLDVTALLATPVYFVLWVEIDLESTDRGDKEVFDAAVKPVWLLDTAVLKPLDGLLATRLCLVCLELPDLTGFDAADREDAGVFAVGGVLGPVTFDIIAVFVAE